MAESLKKDDDPDQDQPLDRDDGGTAGVDGGFDRGGEAAGSVLKEAVRRAVLRDLSYLKALGVRTILETEIIARLLDGRRTPGELAESIYGCGSDDSGFHQYYMRVCRSLEGLESKGYVSRQLFGSRKPFRLTRHALRILSQLEQGNGKELVGPMDLAIYAAACIAATITILAESGTLSLPRPQFMILYTIFTVLAGMSVLRLLQTVRQAW